MLWTLCPYIETSFFKIIVLWTGGTIMKHSDNYYFDVIRHNIKKYRENKKLTQQQLADKAGLTMKYI